MTGTKALVRTVHKTWVAHPRWSLAFKGALAAALAWTVGTMAPAPFSDYPFYAPLGAVIATTTTVARSARESVQSVGALLLGAAIALGADAVLAPSALAVALVVGVALLCAGWRALGDMGAWVANSAIFVLVLGQGEGPEYAGAFAGLVAVGAAIGTGINLILPSMLLTPTELALDELRDTLREQLDDLARWLEDEGPLEPDEWERRRQRLWPTVESAWAAVARTHEASRGNPRARRHVSRVRTQVRRAEELGIAAAAVDEIVRLLVDWEHSGRDDVALGPQLRPGLVTTLRAFAAALGEPGRDAAPADDRRSFVREVDGLQAAMRRSRERSSDDHLVAGALVVVLRRGAWCLGRDDA